MKKGRYVLLLFLFIWTSCLYAAPAQWVNFRAATTVDKTRLVFEWTGHPNYILFNLAQPDRLVLDIKNASASTSINNKLFKNTPIKSVRVTSNKDFIRIVMDLKHPVSSKSFVLPSDNHHKLRLVIDLTTIKPIVSNIPVKTIAPRLAVLPLPAKKIVSTTAPITTPHAVPPPQPVQVASAPAARGRDIIIVIDPGHGGKDPGTTGPSGTHEKDVVLSISRYLQNDLNQIPGFHAVLTRNADYYITLRGRLDIARKDKADMFVAIHADAYKFSDALGASVFALSDRGATSEAARWLAEKENKSELLGGASLPDNDNVLRSVLIDLSQTNTISESLQIGGVVLSELSKVIILHHTKVEQAAFVVLKSPDIPSILVETGFLSTPAQERQLRDPRYQAIIAAAITQGIKDYFMRNPPQGTALAMQRGNY